MIFSVVICTHNRSDSLLRTLQSLEQQTLPHADFEVLVVDNASTDSTKEVVAQNMPKNGSYLYEEKLGLSHARNLGWKSAQGTYVAYLDDDAEASPQWLAGLLTVFNSTSKSNIVVGGRVTLSFSSKKPDWLDDSLLFSLGHLHCGTGISTLNNTTFYLHGCNIAFNKATLAEIGGFASHLGRQDNILLSGEEVYLQKLLMQSGGLLLYSDDASVTHHINVTRLKRRWFLKRMYWEGVTGKRIETALSNTQSFSEEVSLLRHEIVCRSFFLDYNFKKLCSVALRLGRLKESWRNR